MSFFGRKTPPSLKRSFANKRRYHFLAPVGEGGISNVSSFFDTRLNRVVALKELRESEQYKEELQQFFINEAKLIGYLDHPGVIPVFDAFLRGDGGACYTMKLYEGELLTELVEKGKKTDQRHMPLTQSFEIFLKLCETMAYVHDKGVLHLDIKPDNIMIGTYGEVMVLDWGSAYLYDSTRFYEYLEQHTEKTGLAHFAKEGKGIILGTPQYMSPEQTNSSRDTLTCASDIFSAGTVFYEMLTGRHPFPSHHSEELMDQIRALNPPPPHEVNSDLPRRLSQLCMRMLQKNPVNRHGSFHDVLRELAECRIAGETLPVKHYDAGRVIFNEGDAGDYSFMILSGQVEISKWIDGAKRVLARLGPGEVVGELAIISRQPRTATATALEPTRIRVMSKEDVEQELDKLSPWVGKMITGLSGRFIEINDRLAKLDGRGGG